MHAHSSRSNHVAPAAAERPEPCLCPCPFGAFRLAWIAELNHIFGDRWPVLASPDNGELPDLVEAATQLRERVRTKLGDRQALIVSRQASDAIYLLDRVRQALADDVAKTGARHVRRVAAGGRR